MEQKLWFRAKRFGWGWYPVTWQGWGVILFYVFALFVASTYVTKHQSLGFDFAIEYMTQIVVLTTFLIIICYKTGEKPAWRWGKNDARKK